jgi:hypothetical protein
MIGTFAPRLLAIVALAMSAPAFTGAQELLVNPGLESGGNGWGSFGSAGFHNFFGANGHGSLFSDNVGNFGGIFQTGIAGSAGVPYLFKLNDVRIESNTAANYRWGLEFYAADDATKLDETIVPLPLSPTGDGLSFSMNALSNAAGVAFVRPIVLFDSVASSGGQRNVFVFDASLTVVPEPSSVALLTLVGACSSLAASRRR